MMPWNLFMGNNVSKESPASNLTSSVFYSEDGGNISFKALAYV
jgi:hypothetical protein